MIKRVGGGALVGAAILLSAWLSWASQPASGQAEPIPAPQEKAELKYYGVSSCASMACHHFNGAKGSERSEHSTWAGYDKHRQAFAVLENERSARIVKNLYWQEENPEKVPATQRELCLKCHATFTGPAMQTDERFYLGDGVGCESCHGPAEKYLSAHYEIGFKELSADQKHKQFGLWPTKDLSYRVKMCNSCHVGDESKEVNHDLIAAGHPRLNFEVAGYHAIYEKHWDDKAPRYGRAANFGTDFEARLWLVGQLTTAKSAVDLLVTRADSANKPGGRPWPEFAEYACYSCHKSLEVLPSTGPGAKRQELKYGLRRPGSNLYGSWYLSTLPTLSASLGVEGAQNDMVKLKGLMEQAAPLAPSVAAQAKVLSASLDRLISKASSNNQMDATQVRALTRAFLDAGIKQAPALEWDDATQLYLALAAAHQALSDLGDPIANDPKLREDLLKVKTQLRGAFPKGVDSPQLFNPVNPSLADKLQAIKGHLGN